MESFETYPYGRSTEQYAQIALNGSATYSQLTRTGGDDEFVEERIDGYQFVVRYDAPRPDDKGRGHITVWVQFIEDEYVEAYTHTGDDGMIYDQFTALTKGRKSITDMVSLDEVAVLMR